LHIRTIDFFGLDFERCVSASQFIPDSRWFGSLGLIWPSQTLLELDNWSQLGVLSTLEVVRGRIPVCPPPGKERENALEEMYSSRLEKLPVFTSKRFLYEPGYAKYIEGYPSIADSKRPKFKTKKKKREPRHKCRRFP